jgi:hypothetical protein
MCDTRSSNTSAPASFRGAVRVNLCINGRRQIRTPGRSRGQRIARGSRHTDRSNRSSTRGDIDGCSASIQFRLSPGRSPHRRAYELFRHCTRCRPRRMPARSGAVRGGRVGLGMITGGATHVLSRPITSSSRFATACGLVKRARASSRIARAVRSSKKRCRRRHRRLADGRVRSRRCAGGCGGWPPAIRVDRIICPTRISPNVRGTRIVQMNRQTRTPGTKPA